MTAVGTSMSWVQALYRRGVLNQDNAAEVRHRAAADELSLSDLRMLLLVPIDGGGAQAAREAAYARVARRPHLAPSILSMHAHGLGVPVREPEWTPGSSATDGFTARVSMETGGVVHESRWCTARTKKEAHQRAQVSLLASLAGITDEDPAVAVAGGPALPLRETPYAVLNAAEFLSVLVGPGEEDQRALAEHVVVRARSGLMTLSLAERLLFRSTGAVWRRAREEALAAVPNMDHQTALVLLQRFAKEQGLRAPRDEVAPAPARGQYLARAAVGDGDDIVIGPPCTSPSKSQALLLARVHLLAKVTGLPSPENPPARGSELVVSQTSTAVGVLHEAQQRGTVRAVSVTAEDGGLPFTARAACVHQGNTLTGSGKGPSKAAARQAAAESLVLMLNHQLIDPLPTSPAPSPPAAESADAPVPVLPVPLARPARDEADVSESKLPVPPVDPDTIGLQRRLAPAAAPADLVRRALDDGRDLAFDQSAGPLEAGWLLLDPPRDAEVDPDAVVSRRLLLPGGEVDTVECWRVDLSEVLPALLAAPDSGWSTSAEVWAEAARAGLEAIAAGCVYPAISEAESPHERQPVWKCGPLPAAVLVRLDELAKELVHLPRSLMATGQEPDREEPAEPLVTLKAALDALTDQFLPPPAADLLFGLRPFASSVRYPHPVPAILQDWADAVQDEVLPDNAPPMILRIDSPRSPTSTRTHGTLQLLAHPGDPGSAVEARDVWNGAHTLPDPDHDLASRTARALRRAGRCFPPLRPLGAQARPDAFVLSLQDAVLLKGSVGDQLARSGIQVDWAGDWASQLGITAVVGTGSPLPAVEGRMGLGELLDRRWQFALDGTVLEPAELDALVNAAMPWVRLRNRWILIDDGTRDKLRHRSLPSQPARQALLDVLYGTITLDGRTYACTPADGLADLVEELRTPARTTVPAQRSGPTLFPYQASAVHRLSRLLDLGFGGLLADDMGLGKTVTALALHLNRTQRAPAPTLVLCPQSLVDQWCREITVHAPGTRTVRYQGPQRSLAGMRENAIVVTSYHLLRQDHASLADITWGLVIADEAQKLKNDRTQVARLARKLTGRRLALTGTPVENQPDELWAIMDWCNPELFSSRAQFNALYARPIENPGSNPDARQAIDRLHQLLQPFMLRRLKNDPDLGIALPRKNETTHLIGLSREQIGLYEGLSRDTLKQLQTYPSNPRRGEVILNLITSLRKICISPAHYLDEPLETIADNPHEAGRRAPKLEALHQLLHPIREQGESALVFTTYVHADKILAAYLTARGYRTAVFDGQLTPTQRTTVLDAFNTDAGSVLILTPQSGGLGLNLTHANHVIHYNRLWNPAAEEQANDRVYRLGQKRDVHVHHLVAAHSIEERITALLDRKRELARTLLPQGEVDLSALDDSELLRLLTLSART
ncbi:SNF2-related protein [Streptomyces sp. NPDC055078]